MAKIKIQDAGKFGTGGSNDFFTLENDGDMATVRFLYDQPDGSDIDYFVVHEMEISGKKRYVSCLGIDEEGVLHPEDCPLCSAGHKRIEKLFLQVYVIKEDKVKTWDRGKNFVPKILTYINRYQSLVSRPIEIERHGKKGDTNTTYELFPLDADDTQLADLPEKQDLLGTFVLELTSEECEDVLDGVYVLPGSDNNNSTSNRGGAGSRNRASNEPTPRRRGSGSATTPRASSEAATRASSESATREAAPTESVASRRGTRTRRTPGGADSF